jgi:16S rRNA (guanine(966)-N(2))-methyltransferase RsmD
VRIVGGKYRGKKITVSSAFDSRPTTDFAREALFNILNNYFDFERIKMLDLFSGTGSISLEMASRGCHEIDLVDINSKAIQFIGKLADDMSIRGIHAVRMDVFRFIPVCRKKYDIIFADPPYDHPKLREIPELILSHQLLVDDGWFILEHGREHSFRDHLKLFDERNYGSVHFSFFKQ